MSAMRRLRSANTSDQCQSIMARFKRAHQALQSDGYPVFEFNHYITG